jgi:short-subunit dehydrogenase
MSATAFPEGAAPKAPRRHSLPPYRFTGRTAVVTGAASGIGEQLAHGLAAYGSDLVLLDRDEAGLDRVAAAVRAANRDRTVDTIVVDLADRAAATAAATRIADEHASIGLLVNNAGVALAGEFKQLTLEEFEWVVDINFRAPVLLTHHLLPALLADPGSHVVNVSSLYGLIAPPGQTAYSASKFALRGFSQALRLELAPYGVGVTTVHPGGIATNIARSARVAASLDRAEVAQGIAAFERLLSYPPQKAAADILKGVRKRKARVLIAASAKIPDLLARLLPAAHMTVIGAVVGLGQAAAERRKEATGAR